MYLSEVGNQIQCKLCYQVNVNCQICVSAQKCKLCTNGYYLNKNNTCSTCSEYTPYCVFCQQNESYVKCITCEYPRRPINGRCLFGNETDNATAITTTTTQPPTDSTPTGPSTGGNQSSTPATVQVPKCQSNQIEISGICLLAIPFCLNYDLTSLLCK